MGRTLSEHGEDRIVAWLDEDRCWDLLASRSIGRVAVGRPGRGPLVLPVAYVVTAERTIVFHSAPGEKVDALLAGPIAFQVDEVDGLRRTGWSVLVDGHASIAWSEGEDRERWVSWHLPYAVTVHPTVVSGRELVLEHPETDRRGYR
jgi:nitroimidazol reductase NimA-like FMN-containing flavoprotein (pyridoxamine 5'-phosphate oxidase superfamily)